MRKIDFVENWFPNISRKEYVVSSIFQKFMCETCCRRLPFCLRYGDNFSRIILVKKLRLRGDFVCIFLDFW